MPQQDIQSFVKTLIHDIDEDVEDESTKEQLFTDIVLAYEDNIEIDLQSLIGVSEKFDKIVEDLGCKK